MLNKLRDLWNLCFGVSSRVKEQSDTASAQSGLREVKLVTTGEILMGFGGLMYQNILYTPFNFACL